MWDHPELLRRELGRDERLLWSGRPRGGLRFRLADLFLVPFGLFWLGLSLAGPFAVFLPGRSPFSGFFDLFALPFILVGLHMLIGRFVLDALGRAKTYYGLTNRRVLIASDLFAQRVRSLDLRALSDISHTRNYDGSTTITFEGQMGTPPWWSGEAWTSGSRYTRAVPARLEFIDDGDRVYDEIRAAREAATSKPSDE